MNKQPKALQHATYLDSIFVSEDVPAVKARQIAAELRRLHEVNQELLEALQSLVVMAESFASELHDQHPDVIVARAAIAKAGGSNAT